MQDSIMVYELRAIIGSDRILVELSKSHKFAKVVPLEKGLLYIIPLIDDFLDEITGLQTSNYVRGFYYLHEILYNYLKEISTMKGMIAYVEADYFGGKGQQGAVVWDGGECILFKELGKMRAINEALRLFGIIKIGSRDEFETVGLSKRRHTDDWIDII
jgi:hypothetical protein